jgi:hypothetical protein
VLRRFLSQVFQVLFVMFFGSLLDTSQPASDLEVEFDASQNEHVTL